MAIHTYLGFYTPKQLEACLNKCAEMKANFILEKCLLNINFICTINANQIEEEYNQKIQGAKFLKKKFLMREKNSAKKAYSKAIENVKGYLGGERLEKEITRGYLNMIKETNPKEIPKDILEMMESVRIINLIMD